MTDHRNNSSKSGHYLFSGVPEGYDGLLLASKLQEASAGTVHLHVTRDAARMAEIAATLGFFAPDLEVIMLPAWDCLPYDRVSPKRDVLSQRMDALTSLASRKLDTSSPLLVLTTVNAILQRVPAAHSLLKTTREYDIGSKVELEDLEKFLVQSGFDQVGTVREAGEFAIRGGIIDVFSPSNPLPVRMDLFGDEIEGLREFDPITQRTSEEVEKCVLKPSSEVFLNTESIANFRSGYREAFGSVTDDLLYVGISEGRKQIGMEHWLPLFHDQLETIFEYLPHATISLDYEADKTLESRLELIRDYFDARITFAENKISRGPDTSSPYRPLPPERLYMKPEELDEAFDARSVWQFSPYSAPGGVGSAGYTEGVNVGVRRVPDFAAIRATSAASANATGRADNVFIKLKSRLELEAESGKRCIIAALTVGSRERLGQILKDHHISNITAVPDWESARALAANEIALALLPTERGFSGNDVFFITEQDVLGERIVRPEKKRRRAEDFIADVSEISQGDLVVHLEHGIGRYEGLETLDVAGAPHDCLRLFYSGDDRLYVPVENVEVLSRYGSDDSSASLDRLGGAAWQARKARMKSRLRSIAGELIKIAAERQLRAATKISAPDSLYQEFAAQFPYTETEDQADAIADTLRDLSSGTAMDRLVCGDVGFGKTEIALRAAFATVMSGGQVAIVAPTTLLCRQHFATFSERFSDIPVRIEQLSRLVSGRVATEIRKGIGNGEVDIVIGTHALLASSVSFRKLELLVVDEEQHFGVTHKERLKNLKADVHVLTLTATPIPRTLQMALTGVKEMSLIATPPVDRLAVRTFVMPFDEVMVREAIMREHFRGGQTFYVCPRVGNLDEIAVTLRHLVPEVKIAIAHGQMGTRGLEEAMAQFYEGKTDLLLSTQIIESGLDIPKANTMIVHRAEMFGLAQLYQLRGRIGRSKLRAYCYLTLPSSKKLTDAANKRLEVMQSLDTLGAGFTLASHDLDIRGAGNLLGVEQSGQIREVGAELYQQMLEEDGLMRQKQKIQKA